MSCAVHAPSAASNNGGHAVWLDPYITRPAGYRKPEPARPPTPENAKPGDKDYLSDLPELEAGPFPSGWHFGKNGDPGDGEKIKVEGKESAKGLGMHPPGGEKACSVKYQLDGCAITLEATVAISENFRAPASDVIFEVFGDGKSLWKSKPVKRGGSEKCAVDLKGVHVLELRTMCGAPTGCHAVWLDPFIIRSPGKRSLAAIEPIPDRKLAAWGTPIDPDKDCEFSSAAKTLTVTVPGTLHDLNHDSGKLNAPRVVRAVVGDFVATVKVGGDFQAGGRSTNPKGIPYNGGGILIWSDTDNFIRLERGAMRRGGRVNTIVAFEERKKGNRGAVQTDTFPAGTCYLRLERKDGRFFAAVSADGSSWRRLTPIDTVWPARLKVGLLAINSSTEPFAVRFEGFAIEGKGAGPDAPPSPARHTP